MPQVAERPDLALQLLKDIDAAHDATYREHGYPEPHVSYSSLAYCLRRAWCLKNPSKCLAGPPEGAADRMSRNMGLALHALMAHAESAKRSVNIDLRTLIDGIWFVGEADSIVHATPDGIEVDAIEDNKTTRKQACDYNPERDPAYIEQLAMYLVMHNTRFARLINTGVMHVWHFIGCYGSKKMERERDQRPRPTSWQLRFGWDELNKWRKEMVRRGKIITGPDLPAPSAYKWECDYCPFAAKRGGFCPGPTGLEEKLAGFFEIENVNAIHETDD